MSSEPDLEGRVALVTGANTGIGLVTARELARRGAKVFIACRSEERGRTAADAIHGDTGKRVEVLPLDLGDLTSVRRSAEAFLAKGTPLHLLINNAGLAGARGISRSGFEIAFGVNHVGHYLLTRLLLPKLEQSAPARIVNVSSKAHYQVKAIDWAALRKPTRTLTGLPEYGVSKLANILFTSALARRLSGKGVTAYALHPGVVASDVWRAVPWPFGALMKLRMLSTEEGARTSLYCATSTEVAQQSGLYYDECKVKEPSELARDTALAEKLWVESEAWTLSRS